MTALKRSSLCIGENHALVAFDRQHRKRQIECKHCRWVRGERKLTTRKCSVCKMSDVPFEFCKERNCFALSE